MVAAVAASVLTPNAQAALMPTTLQNLIDDGGITYGDKTFSDFAVTGSVLPSNIDVVQAPGPNLGLEFQYNWSSSNGENQDTVIHYKVHVNDPAQSINGVGLSFNGKVTGDNPTGLTSASVTETISDAQDNFLGQITVPNGASNSNTFTVSPSTHDLFLDKDIMVHSPVGGSGTATITLVDNTFMQVPEPATLGLLTLAAPALLLRKRRLG